MKTEIMAKKLLLQWNLKLVVVECTCTPINCCSSCYHFSAIQILLSLEYQVIDFYWYTN